MGKYHSYFSHHLIFDHEAGQEDFRTTVNRIDVEWRLVRRR